MTYSLLKKASLATLTALALIATLPAASAMAADKTSEGFVVKSTTDGRIKIGVKAYKQGNYNKTVRMTRAALETSLSPKRAAIAHTNLCAAYAKLDMLDEARQACAAAVKLRPNYEPAKANIAALNIILAQK